MGKILLSVALASLCFTLGCSSKPKVAYQFDSKADFAAYKTYIVEPTKSPTLDLRMLDSKPMAQTIQDAIEKQLDSKGLRKVASGQADLVVRWRAAIEYDAGRADAGTPGLDVDLNKPDSGFILDTGSSGEGIPQEVAKGGIRIDLLSAQTQKPVWCGAVGSVLQPNAPDPKRVERLNASLTKLFANYPPKPARK